MTDATMDQGSTRRHWGGLILGAMLLGVLIWRLPWAEALVTLREVRLAWWVPALVLGAFGVWFRALRLHLVLGVPRPLLSVWRAVALGYLAGLVLPAGGGEVVKIRTLMKGRDLDILHAGSAVTLDRLFDLLGLVLGLALLAGLQALPGSLGTLLNVLAVALVFAWLILVLLIVQGQAVLSRSSDLLPRFTWLARKIERMGTLLAEAGHLRGARTWLPAAIFHHGLRGLCRQRRAQGPARHGAPAQLDRPPGPDLRLHRVCATPAARGGRIPPGGLHPCP